jgi:hypothetical protein
MGGLNRKKAKVEIAQFCPGICVFLGVDPLMLFGAKLEGNLAVIDAAPPYRGKPWAASGQRGSTAFIWVSAVAGLSPLHTPRLVAVRMWTRNQLENLSSSHIV